MLSVFKKYETNKAKENVFLGAQAGPVTHTEMTSYRVTCTYSCLAIFYQMSPRYYISV